MLFKKHKEHLYDSKNFDKYDNVYVIKADENKVDQFIYDVQTNFELLQHKYDKLNRQIIIYFLDYSNIIITIKSFYKIIFGHFYNAFNDFLFKKTTSSKKVNNTNVYRCNNELLLKNKENDLISSKSYDEISEHNNEILEQKESLVSNKFIKPNIMFEDNIINVDSLETDVLFEYENNCINIKNKKNI